MTREEKHRSNYRALGAGDPDSCLAFSDRLAPLPKREAPMDVPVVIDAGSWQFRAGYATESSPSMIFEPLVGRVQAGKTGEPAQWAVGKPVVTTSKSSSRTPFESPTCPALVHVGSLEHILDHVLASLHVGSKAHPLVMTEMPGNPTYCRAELAELVFEGYQVPKLMLGIDSVFGLLHNQPDVRTALIVSAGSAATHILPIVDGQLVWKAVRRIDWGGAVGTDQLQRLLSLKYPAASGLGRLTWSQAGEAFREACAVHPGLDYSAFIGSLAHDAGSSGDFVLQMPFQPTDQAALAANTVEREALAAKRREQAERLREKARRAREERLQAKREHVDALLEMKRKIEGGGEKRAAIKSDLNNTKRKSAEEDEGDGSSELDLDIQEDEDADGSVEELLALHGYQTMDELDGAITAAEKDLRIYEARVSGTVLPEEPGPQQDYSLLDIPDDQLEDGKLAEKRRLRLMKAGADHRERARLAKEEAQRAAEAEKEVMEKLRAEDFESWARKLYGDRKVIQQRQRTRQQRREALSDRRSQASGARLRSVVTLAADDSIVVSASGAVKDAPGMEDDFGARDSDWQVYRDIRSGQDQEALEAEEEAAERDQARLSAIEEELERHDGESFYALLTGEMAQARTILDALRDGPVPQQQPDKMEDEEARRHQIHLNVERWRVPEALFRPRALLGKDEGGLVETIEAVLSTFPPALQTALSANIFVAGGTSKLPGLLDRLRAELRSTRPASDPISISAAADPVLDAWRGAAKASAWKDAPWVTRSWYEEHGADRLQHTAFYTNPY